MTHAAAPAADLVAVCGLKAVRGLFKHRPQLLRRLYFDEEHSRKVGPITTTMATQRRVYRLVQSTELEKIAGTVHHGGIVAMIDPPSMQEPTAEHVRQWGAQNEPVLVLDRVSDAHNLGAIARTAAWFGVTRLILPDDPKAARPKAAAWRVAEGGMSFMDVHVVRALAPFLNLLTKAGHYEVVGATLSRRATALGKTRPLGTGPAINSAKKPMALVMGNEDTGISTAVEQMCTQLVHIPGLQNMVQSLNVSAATAILMWELFGSSVAARDRSQPTPPRHQQDS